MNGNEDVWRLAIPRSCVLHRVQGFLEPILNRDASFQDFFKCLEVLFPFWQTLGDFNGVLSVSLRSLFHYRLRVIATNASVDVMVVPGPRRAAADSAYFCVYDAVRKLKASSAGPPLLSLPNFSSLIQTAAKRICETEALGAFSLRHYLFSSQRHFRSTLTILLQ